MLATDPLSLVFVACIVFAGAFLVLSSVLGLGHGHALHFGHSGHLAHIGHTAHVAHVAHTAQSTSATHATDAHTASHTTSHSASQNTSQNATHAATHGQTSADAPATPPAPVSFAQNVSTALLGALNLHGALMFLLVFGLLGYILHNAAHAGALLAIFVPLLFAAAAAIGTSTLLRHFFEADSSGVLTAGDSRIEGQLGTVTMAIRAGGLGEVVFTREGRGRQSVSARGADGEAIPAGAEIVILDYDQGIANVQTWDRFMSAARAARLTSPPPGTARE